MPNPLGVAVTAAIVTVVLTPAVACVVLRRFRGAMMRSMLAASTGALPSTREAALQPISGSPPAGTVEMLEVPQVVPSRLGGLAARATGQVRRAICWYVAAGLAYAATQTVVLFLLQGHAFVLPRGVVVGCSYSRGRSSPRCWW